MTITRDPIRGQPSHPPEPSKSGETPNTAAKPGAGLYIVATPIGNLGDITRRAVALLGQVDIIAAEDTRSARRLCAALGLATPRLVRYDDHADQADRDNLIQAIKQGRSVALISDAGMPLVADPGLKLVQEAQREGVPVTALPGPSAALTALALSGLPSDRFLFAGFLPPKDGARRRALAELADVPASLILFETGPRLAASLAAMVDTLGTRPAAVARELTKLVEEVRRGSLAELAAAYAEAEPPKGEIVVVIGPPEAEAPAAAEDIDARLRAALATLSLRDAVAAVAATTGRKRREVYARALALDHQPEDGKA